MNQEQFCKIFHKEMDFFIDELAYTYKTAFILDRRDLNPLAERLYRRVFGVFTSEEVEKALRNTFPERFI